jgi:Zn-dependent M16 (insulinase) family peptidase
MLSASNSRHRFYNQPQGPFLANVPVEPVSPSSKLSAWNCRYLSNMTRREDQNSDNAYLHATLQQIDHLANEDVEMQVSCIAGFVSEITENERPFFFRHRYPNMPLSS